MQSRGGRSRGFSLAAQEFPACHAGLALGMPGCRGCRHTETAEETEKREAEERARRSGKRRSPRKTSR